jgi:hypothetical protein
MELHDNAYKSIFSQPESVRDLLLGFVPEEWVQLLDFEDLCNLEKVPASYVTDDFRTREDDTIRVLDQRISMILSRGCYTGPSCVILCLMRAGLTPSAWTKTMR